MVYFLIQNENSVLYLTFIHNSVFPFLRSSHPSPKQLYPLAPSKLSLPQGEASIGPSEIRQVEANPVIKDLNQSEAYKEENIICQMKDEAGYGCPVRK